MVGLPGTGIGGIFYALNVVWMLGKESLLVLVRRRRNARWSLVLTQGFITSLMIIMFWLTGIVLQLWLPVALVSRLGIIMDTPETRLGTVMIPLLILTMVFGTTHLLRMIVRFSSYRSF